MNLFRITLTLGFLAVSVVLVSSEEIEEYDYADNGAAPQPPQPSSPLHRGRSPLLASRQNKASPLTSNANKITKQSGAGGKAALSAKAAAPPPPPSANPEEQEEEIVEYDENPEEPVEATTEPPKKTIKPTKRPFRSNDDLLAALKRRRQQVQSSGSVVDKTTTTSTTTAPASNKKSSNSFGSTGRRNRNGGNRSPAPQTPQDDYNSAAPAAEADSSRKGSQSRKYNNRSGARSVPAPVLEEIPAEEQPKPKFGRGSRRP